MIIKVFSSAILLSVNPSSFMSLSPHFLIISFYWRHSLSYQHCFRDKTLKSSSNIEPDVAKEEELYTACLFINILIVFFVWFSFPLSICPPPAISPWWCRWRSWRQLSSYWFLESAQTWTYCTMEPEYGGVHPQMHLTQNFHQSNMNLCNISATHWTHCRNCLLNFCLISNTENT